MKTTGYTRTYTSFSGADIKAVIGSRIMAECQGCSVSITREKAPLYTLGSPDPRSFSRGKRGISGSLIFLIFNRFPLPDTLKGDDRQFMGDKVESAMNDPIRYGEAIDRVATAAALNTVPGQPGDNRIEMDAWYADQLPPFDLMISASNEYGHAAQMDIIGIEILNTGTGFSVDDITMDESHTFVARRIRPWHTQRRVDSLGAYGDETTEDSPPV